MLENMRRLHSRGAGSRGISVDVDGAMLGPHCALVQRLPGGGYRGLERDAASVLQKAVFNDNREPDWLFRQTDRIAHALDKGEIALAQIYGLYIPIGELDDRQLAKTSAAARLTKSGYNPDEPRIPRGNPLGGEWTTGDTGSAGDGPDANAASTGPFAIDAMAGGGSGDGEDDSGGDGSVGSGQTTPSNPVPSGGVAGSSPATPPLRWEMKPLPNPPPAPPPVQDNSDDQPPPDDDASGSPATLGSDDLGSPVPLGSDPADEALPPAASGASPNSAPPPSNTPQAPPITPSSVFQSTINVPEQEPTAVRPGTEPVPPPHRRVAGSGNSDRGATRSRGRSGCSCSRSRGLAQQIPAGYSFLSRSTPDPRGTSAGSCKSAFWLRNPSHC